ncbi:MAG TPA: hypothetical protein VJ922_04930 [Actinomycetota bacterium]|nr:hypothetical protein [Actinomycetota bacterium]
MTIGRERYGYSDPPHVRRSLLYLGLTLVALSGLLTLPLGSLAVVVNLGAMLTLIYAFLPSSYPLLGVIASLALAGVPFTVALWVLND